MQPRKLFQKSILYIDQNTAYSYDNSVSGSTCKSGVWLLQNKKTYCILTIKLNAHFRSMGF